jgi:MFS family permease
MTTVATRQQQQQPIRSTIPARLDRLRWSPFHTRLVLGLGTAWILLDGLEITIASSVSGKLTQANTLNLSTAQASAIGTVYLVGEVVGALVFGRLSDKLGRRSCSCGPWRSTWSAPVSRRWHSKGAAGWSTSTPPASSRAPASAASTQPSTRPSMR